MPAFKAFKLVPEIPQVATFLKGDPAAANHLMAACKCAVSTVLDNPALYGIKHEEYVFFSPPTTAELYLLVAFFSTSTLDQSELTTSPACQLLMYGVSTFGTGRPLVSARFAFPPTATFADGLELLVFTSRQERARLMEAIEALRTNPDTRTPPDYASTGEAFELDIEYTVRPKNSRKR